MVVLRGEVEGGLANQMAAELAATISKVNPANETAAAIAAAVAALLRPFGRVWTRSCLTAPAGVGIG